MLHGRLKPIKHKEMVNPPTGACEYGKEDEAARSSTTGVVNALSSAEIEMKEAKQEEGTEWHQEYGVED